MRDGLAAADRCRRAREASRRSWHAAPAAAGAGLCTAAIAHWAAWPAFVPLGVLLAGALWLVARAMSDRRARPVSDATAGAIDAEAGMGGELRSASWFAACGHRDEWADFHLASAAGRLTGVRWAELYPPPPAPRARLATAVMAIAALALAFTTPETAGTGSAAAAGPPPRTVSGDAHPWADVLPPELQRWLQELLASVESGNVSVAEALSGNADLRDMLGRISQHRNPELLEALARSIAAAAGAEERTPAEEMDALAERARRAAASAALSQDMRSALEKLADELEIATPDGAAAAADADGAAANQSLQTAGDPAGAAGPPDEVSIQFAQESDAGGGLGTIMLSSQDPGAGAGSPGAGFGGASSPEHAGAMADIEAALRRETVEAANDQAGGNVTAEIRRRTERGDATVTFTRSGTRIFDPTRAAPPPPVPETRRTGVQTYFHRTQ